MPTVRTNAVREAIIALLAAAGLFGLLHALEAHHALHELMERYGGVGADSVILGIFVLGTVGFVYGYRQNRGLRRESQVRRKAEEDARWYAFHDPLTKLLNRHYLDETLLGNTSTARPELPTTVFAIDLDDFKSVNDLVGHQGGDRLISIIADRLVRIFPDDEVIRVGGDEFIVLSNWAWGDDALGKASETIAELRRPVAVSGVQTGVGASVGICDVRTHPGSMAEAFHHADLALYAAKRHGRNTARLFEPWMQDEQHNRVKIQQELRTAIREGAIVPHYQPLVRIETGEVCGFEALARWTDKRGIPVPPLVFITVAEESSLISDLSNSLFRRVCTDACYWPADMRLAFNISPRQLADRRLATIILAILRDTGFPPERLDLEITESVMVQDWAVAQALFQELRHAGIRIVLDDFGTGHSSLAQLASIPCDHIKIDGRFVTALDDPRQREVIKAVASLAAGLGITTTAERIETPEQLRYIKRIGCDFGQGYLLGRPMPAQEIPRLLSASGSVSARTQA